MRVHWIGGATAFLEVGAFRVLTDPVLGEGEALAPLVRLAPLPPFDLVPLDAVLLSHVHPSHLDAAAAGRLRKDTPVVAPPDQAAFLRARGFTGVVPLGWWERTGLARGGASLRILALPAWHSADPGTSLELGTVNGYLIEHVRDDEHRVIYWTGDTVWFDGLAVIRERAPRIDLLLPHVGAAGAGEPKGRRTLDAAEAARLIALVAPRAVVPIHHHTFSHYTEPIEALRDRLAGGPHADRLHLLHEGEAAVLP